MKKHLFLSCLIAFILACILFLLGIGFKGNTIVSSDFVDCSAVSEIPLTECEALVALYNETDGENWYNHTNWLTNDSPCSWYGVGCSGGHVNHLDGSSNNLTGTIPEELGNLTNLDWLGLNGNQLTGSIPAEIGNLTKLTFLHMGSNPLNGNLPAELGNLINLTSLVLGDNQITGSIPPELGNLTNLTNMDLRGCQLSGSIPAELGNLTNLTRLSLDNNQLSGNIPMELGSLTNLTWLSLENNQLNGSIPPELGNLFNLAELNLKGNQFSGSIPKELGNLTSLKGLNLAVNQLTGTIPSELGNLINLTILELHNNLFTGSIPPELGNLTYLTRFSLSENPSLMGSVPPEMGNMINLTSLWIQSTQLSGSLPLELANLTQLAQFHYSHNYLCLPDDADFYSWLTSIPDRDGTNEKCDTIPITPFAAHPNEERIEGWEWTLGSTVSIVIDDPTTQENPDISNTTVVGTPDWDPNQTWFNLNIQGYDLKGGDIITVTDGITTKSLTVSALQISKIDFVNDVVTGIAAPGSLVYVDADNTVYRHETAGSDGVWTADFAKFGDKDDEQNTFDIIIGTNVNSQQIDDDEDKTILNVELTWPYFEAFPGGFIRAWDSVNWPFGTEMTLVVDDPSDGLGELDQDGNPVDYYDTATMAHAPWDTSDPNNNLVEFAWPVQFSPVPGYIISMSGNGITKTLRVTNFSVLNVDLDADTISGIGTPGFYACIMVDTSNITPGGITVRRCFTVNDSGNWIVNFHELGPGDVNTTDIQIRSGGYAIEEDDDRDITWIGWSANQIISVQPFERQVSGNSWSMGALMTLTIDDPATVKSPDYLMLQKEGNTENWISFDLGGIYTIKPGDIVTMTDGIHTKTHVVTNLAIQSVNPDTDQVFGTADPGDIIRVIISDSNSVERRVTADINGNWVANFSDENEGSTFDVIDGTSGEAFEYDLDEDNTNVFWRVPNPTFAVRPNEERVEGVDWILGSTVSVTIDDPATPENPDFTNTAVVNVADWDPNQTWFNLVIQEYDLKEGDFVTVSDGITTKTHIVYNFVISGFDLEEDTLFGVAQPNQQVYVWTCKDNDCANREETADPLGNWTVDFSMPGNLDWEQTTADLVDGSWVDSSVNDEDGDTTQIGFAIQNPINEPPEIISITTSSNPVKLRQAVSATVNFSDPNVNDTHTITWDWGDGTPPLTGTQKSSTHLYLKLGIYKVTVTVTDQDGLSDSETSTDVVIYNPKAGYVSGRGLFYSPAGSYIADPSLAGRVNFTFVSRYWGNGTTPSGLTLIHFTNPNLLLTSFNYDWMLINKNKAIYQGTGTINGRGTYSFLISMIDGRSDKIRIKVWDKATGSVIYDNLPGAAYDADPNSIVNRGSIEILKR